jgi:hypothetical protein
LLRLVVTSKISVLDYLGVIPSLVSPILGVDMFQTRNEIRLTMPAAVLATEDWLKVFAESVA